MSFLTYMDEGLLDERGDPTPAGRIIWGPWALLVHVDEGIDPNYPQRCRMAAKFFTWDELLGLHFGTEYHPCIRESIHRLLRGGSNSKVECPGCDENWRRSVALKMERGLCPEGYGVMVSRCVGTERIVEPCHIWTKMHLVLQNVWHTQEISPRDLHRTLALTGRVSASLEAILDNREDNP